MRSPSSAAPQARASRGASIADGVRVALRAAADPSRAAGQQAYMKSAMPFIGVRVPDARRIARAAVAAGASAAEVLDAATGLWDGAVVREERYAAMALLGTRPLRRRAELVPVIERFAVEGRWWDITDELAHRVAELIDQDAAGMRPIVLAWSVDRRDVPAVGAGLWLRRLAILAQLGRGDRVDRELLTAVIEPNVGDPDFFIRKAIGWALREVARHDPGWVLALVDALPLSPLSRREALKHVG